MGKKELTCLFVFFLLVTSLQDLLTVIYLLSEWVTSCLMALNLLFMNFSQILFRSFTSVPLTADFLILFFPDNDINHTIQQKVITD